MNNLIESLSLDKKVLDLKKQQTEYKINYVVEYIKLWLLISSERNDINNINFIDGMCNAGIYEDGDLGTPIRVLLLFQESARLHPEKTYILFLNDYNAKRIKIIKSLITYYEDKKIKNLKVLISNTDINTYLERYDNFDNRLKYHSSTVLFVDPYDLGTVIIDKMVSFIKTYYCELIFNFFSSDYVRNGLDDRIKRCIGNAQINNKDELFKYMRNCLYVNKIKYVFSYTFKTSKNTELYQIIFATPSSKGLDVLKQSLWKIFKGKFFHRNFEDNEYQTSMLTLDDEEELLLSIHAQEAKDMLTKKYYSQTKPYNIIENFLAENTMMMEAQFLNSVIKPLISDGYIIKCNHVANKNNYKKDSYFFVKE